MRPICNYNSRKESRMETKHNIVRSERGEKKLPMLFLIDEQRGNGALERSKSRALYDDDDALNNGIRSNCCCRRFSSRVHKRVFKGTPPLFFDFSRSRKRQVRLSSNFYHR